MNKIIRGFAIYDKKIKSYSTPFYVDHDIQAQRQFIKIVMDEDTMINQFPEHFELHSVNEFNTENGTTVECIEKILDGKAIYEKFNGGE